MNSKMCAKCKVKPAVIYITRIEGDKSIPEGLCISCAREMQIQPINDLLDKMNIPDEDLEAMSSQIMQMMDSMTESENSDDEDGEGFFPGGAATFPFFKDLMSGDLSDWQESLAIMQNGEKPDNEKEAKPEKIVKGKDKEKVNEKDKDKEKVNDKDKKKNVKKRKYLDGYCTDLTRRAKEGKLDKIIGREKEMYRTIQILSRRSKNNPCLIGEPGVGKTAIAECLALKIASGDVPAKLIDKELHLLDLTALVAGTQFRGQFESRVKGLVEEVKLEGNIILFIDEVHNLVGTGDAEGSMNAANILKPALSRGEIQVIGATTFKEYRKHIEKDAALERRFQPVIIEEPSIHDTIQLLNGIKEYYEVYHDVNLEASILAQAVTLSERYITDRYLPDKAIDLLDEACACARLRNLDADKAFIIDKKLKELVDQELTITTESETIDFEELAKVKEEIARYRGQREGMPEKSTNTVTHDDLAKVIELWTGIPSSKIKENDLSKLANLEDKLKDKIIGQNEAIDVIASAVRRSRVQISPRRKPASFIFVGPTGVGKTELVKVLAKELFDTPETLIKIDMSEFMEKHSVSRIIGAPPGYVGYDDAGQLTEKVRRKPYSVILFDEIEKAHPDVMNILLQVLDDGKITDAQGRTINFENTIIIMTSNAGSENKGGSVGFGKTVSDANKDKIIKALEQFLRPEFLGRIDEIVVFEPLNDTSLETITRIMLDELIEPLREKGIEFTYQEQVPAYVCSKITDSKRGARALRNAVRREIEDKIAFTLVQYCDIAPSSMNVELIDGKIEINTK